MSQIRKNPDIVISADSTIDMPPTLIQRYNIAVIAGYVLLGDREEKDYPRIKQEDLFHYYNTTGQLPKTAAASPWDYHSHFAELTKKNRYVIHISKSSGISSCYQNAVSAASDFPNIWVVDSLNLSGGSGLLVREAAASAITDPEKLVAHLLKFRQRIDGSFIIETLTYLKEGGRCSSVALLGANVLKLRPEIVVENGTMHVSRKYRGSFEKCVSHTLTTR